MFKSGFCRKLCVSPGSRGLGEAGQGHQGTREGEDDRAPRNPTLPPAPTQAQTTAWEGDTDAPHCVDNRNHKIAITVSEAVNKEDIPGF